MSRSQRSKTLLELNSLHQAVRLLPSEEQDKIRSIMLAVRNACWDVDAEDLTAAIAVQIGLLAYQLEDTKPCSHS